MDHRIKKKKIQYEETINKFPKNFGLFKADERKLQLLFHLRKGTLFNFQQKKLIHNDQKQQNLIEQNQQNKLELINLPIEQHQYIPKQILSCGNEEQNYQNVVEETFIKRRQARQNKILQRSHKAEFLQKAKLHQMEKDKRKKLNIKQLQRSRENHREKCRKEKMKKYFNEQAIFSPIKTTTIDLFKKMMGKNSKFQYKSMEKSIKSLHLSTEFDKSLFKTSFNFQAKKKRIRMKKIRSSHPLNKQIKIEQENQSVPLFLTQKLQK